ncbi:MAG: Fic family protein [bacterium]|nr:Fic family protein [bacterium]
MTRPGWNPDQPYNDLPPIPSGHVLETRAVLRACVPARAALAELKQAAALIPNQAMLINTLPVLEAQASSAVENIVTTMDRLFENLHAESGADPATKEALRYRRSLMEGYRALEQRPLCTRTAELVCTTIKGVDMRVRRVPGTKLANAATGGTIYTPPVGEDTLRRHLAAWERFLHDERELDPLIRMAAGHYQFEAIHPFTDGNGRTGRVLNSLFLIQEGLLSMPILYLSKYIIANRGEYYDRLIAVTRDEAWEPWLLYMLEAVRTTSLWTLDRIRAIRELSDATARRVRAELPKVYSRELVDVIFEQPYCRIENLVVAGIAKRQTASRYLQLLAGLGVLEARRVGREVLYIHPALLAVLVEER